MDCSFGGPDGLRGETRAQQHIKNTVAGGRTSIKQGLNWGYKPLQKPENEGYS
jgi:hypothetical protein